MHLINGKNVENGMVEGLCFLSKMSLLTEIRFLTVRSYFSVRQYLATVVSFLFTLSQLNLEAYTLASLV